MISLKTKKLIEGSSLIREMFTEGAKLKKIYGAENVFDFSIGNPSVFPPLQIKSEINSILNEENPTEIHGYMDNCGFVSVRKKIADSINNNFETNFNEKNIIMTVGAAGALNIIFKTILNPSDEVLVFAPFFGEYVHYVNNYDGKIIVTPPNYCDFQINFEQLEKNITAKTKAVIINSPNNPTGVVYSEKTLIRLSKILNEKQKEFNSTIFLIADEPYREIVFGETEVPFVTKFYKNTFVAYSYSKSLSLPGERIGYIICPCEMDFYDDVFAGLSVSNRILGFVNAPSLFQKVVGNLTNVKVDVTPYFENLDLLYNSLTSFGYQCVKPNGAFYLFPKAPIEDDILFCKMAKDLNLLLVPGSAFNCNGYFRIAFCTSKETVEKSIPVFKKLINDCLIQK